ncbi:D-alanyl-D-alanine carboxypeptidase family protein [Streptomyces yaizuensis]|uniref:Serine hydrolase n=1 Tax=Streptomyces yaizuensis TaxID=2989713 RepID=A0ABQ5P221_9ACTN|nr:serine hydrolase [Streptomyces sp. YSPA8]GLF96644.1 serine hydrolase [Streptomyces sp. YSPA8]
MRRAATVVLTGGLLLTVSPLAAPAQAAARPKPVISGAGGYLMDLKTGKALFSKGDTTRRQMASTTKLVTAITVLTTKGVDLNRKVAVTKTHVDYQKREGGSHAKIIAGDKFTIRQLLHAMMLESGCEAAYALADALGKGSTPATRAKSFIGMMNKKAVDLKLKNTKFDSFDGISPGGKNYTTPSELTKLAKYAFGNKTFRDIVKAKEYKATATAPNGRPRYYTWKNTNLLLGSYKGTVGVKTGTGTAAGPCLVFAATRGSKTYIGVILKGKDVSTRYQDAAKLLDYGFGSTTAKTMKLRSLPAGVQAD